MNWTAFAAEVVLARWEPGECLTVEGLWEELGGELSDAEKLRLSAGLGALAKKGGLRRAGHQGRFRVYQFLEELRELLEGLEEDGTNRAVPRCRGRHPRGPREDW